MVRRHTRRFLVKTNYNYWASKAHTLDIRKCSIVSTLVFSSQKLYSFFVSRVCLFRWKLKRLSMFMTPYFVGFNIGLFFLTKVPFLHLHRAKKKKNMTEKNKKKINKRRSKLAWKRRNVKKRTTSNHIYIHRNVFYISKNLRQSRLYNTPKVRSVVFNKKDTARDVLRKKLTK